MIASIIAYFVAGFFASVGSVFLLVSFRMKAGEEIVISWLLGFVFLAVAFGFAMLGGI